MKNPLRILMRNKRAVLSGLSYISAGLGFVHIWRKRKVIDQIMDESYDARHSDDKKVRREAQWDTTKKLVPVLAPSIVTIGLGAVGIGVSHYQTAEEIHRIQMTTEQLSAAVASPINPPLPQQQNTTEETIIPPNTRPYYFAMTGEILYLPKNWHEQEMIVINKEIEEIYKNSDEGITLGEIRWAIGLRDDINLDDLIRYPQNYAGRFDPPQLEIQLPNEFHGRGLQQDFMLEIHITGFMAIDEHYSYS